MYLCKVAGKVVCTIKLPSIGAGSLIFVKPIGWSGLEEKELMVAYDSIGCGEGDVIFGLLSGGTLAAAFILITDPATGPKSTPGYAVFVLLCAFFVFLFHYPALDPYGTVTAILLGNTLVPLIIRIENSLYYEKRKRS